MELNSSNVYDIFKDCMFKENELSQLKDGEIPEGAVLVHGIVNNVGFHPDRLESHRSDTLELLKQLPEGFKQESKEQGLSFLLMGVRSDDTPWGEHRNMEQLMLMALGLDIMHYLLPRQLWFMCPGGVPMLQIKVGALD